MQGELIELQRTLKKTIIFITHDLDEALILGDRIAIMKGGRIVQIGTARQIVNEPADDYVAAFTQNIDRARVLTAESAAVPASPVEHGHAAEAAMRRMEELDRDALYVVSDGRPVGVVLYRELKAAGHGPGVRLTDCRIVSEFPTARRETPLKNLYGLASTGLPIAVTDEDGKLAMIVEASALLRQIAESAAEEMPKPEASAGAASAA
jgi:glycine betaine/proline transport system ATP-binding protein